MAVFDLIDTPWIPVRTGHIVREVGLRDVLVNAHQYERIEDSSPLIVASLHRLLLAVLHRALQGPEDIEVALDLIELGTFPADAINNHLAKWQHRFDLFNDSAPFMQFVAVEGVNEAPVTKLALERASGSEKLLFDHTVDANVEPIPANIAARWLITNQATAIPGGRGYSPGTAGGMALTLPFGETLFETLCLNLIEYTSDEYKVDKPTWELPAPTPNHVETHKETPILGLTHRYTWLSRIIRLVPDTTTLPLTVSHIHYASGYKPAESSRRLHDPMVAYRLDEKRGKLPVGFRLGRGFWRDFQALIPAKDSAYQASAVIAHASALRRRRNQALPTMVLGLSNDKAKAELWRTEVFYLPPQLATDKRVHPLIGEALDYADKVGSALHKGAWCMATDMLTTGDRSLDKGDVSNLIKSLPLDTVYWSALETEFVGFLELFQRDFTKTSVESWWHVQVDKAASQAWQQATQSLGTSGRALRAINEGRRVFAGNLAKLKPEQPAQKV